jgi:predicted ester cyclase/catechol 2,3-dioxygenase-like lactoylglutathione lyase family enzyme
MNPRPDRVSDLIPFVHVSDLPRSIAFYELLGFEVGDTYEVEGELRWVALQHAHARIMLEVASAPIDPHQQAILFYLYAEDLDGLRDHLIAHGLRVGPIRDGTPGPKREVRISDPDGYCLMIAESKGESRRDHVPPEMTSPDEGKALVRRLVEIVNEGDLEALEDVTSGQIAEAVRHWIGPFRDSFPDFHMEVSDVISEGDTVVGHFKCSGTHAGEWQGIPASGRRFENVDEIYIFRVENGKLASATAVVEDNLTRMRQLGVR